MYLCMKYISIVIYSYRGKETTLHILHAGEVIAKFITVWNHYVGLGVFID
jgi:hypothetical protein